MPFPSIVAADDATLHWRQPGALGQSYSLCSAERELGRLHYPSPTHSRAVAETAAGRWTFEPEGFWRPRIVVLRDEQPVASLDVTAVWLRNRAVLVADDAAVLAEWDMTSYQSGVVEWRDVHGAPLVRFRSGSDDGGAASWIRWQCRVDFTDPGLAHPHRDLLVCLGWHMATLVASLA